jgi:RimJ/RimL family protein N-acetyltransferase
MRRLSLAIPTEAAYRSLHPARYQPDVVALADDVPCAPTLSEYLAVRRDRMRDPSCVERVIMIDGQPAGTVTAFSLANRACELGIVLVYPHHWGQGLGTEALDQFLDLLRVMGVRRVSLETFEQNARAQAAFRKLGFVEVRRYIDPEIGQPLVVMQHVISSVHATDVVKPSRMSARKSPAGKNKDLE